MIDERRRSLVHGILVSSRNQGARPRGGVPALARKLTAEELSLSRQLDSLLLRVTAQSREALFQMADADDAGPLLEAAWTVLAPARLTGGLEGDYQVTFPEGQVVRYTLSQWDGEVVRAYDQLLTRIYERDRAELDRAFQQQGAAAGATAAGPVHDSAAPRVAA